MLSTVELNTNGRPTGSMANAGVLQPNNGDRARGHGRSRVREWSQDAGHQRDGRGEVKAQGGPSQGEPDHYVLAVYGKVTVQKTGIEMRKCLVDTYEGTANAVTRTNQEIIMYHKLQAARCKPN
ncbi:hypothetical protein GN244_ATG10508 [Phytophthora infestans]|uniref:Uncharacterized protein n=1 Tax=Phytophthora infestans TaxID=4787 RepID=A0A833T4M1_PHYIN|nr:hypothetical protein GN244_ATG10508 [Phytophthora infestans]